jgi:hypothetical protein
MRRVPVSRGMVYSLWEGEELQHIRQQIYELEVAIYDRYEVEAMVKALPLSSLPKPELLPKG